MGTPSKVAAVAAAVTAVIAIAPAASAAAPAASAAPAVSQSCSDPGFKFTVKDTGIHIRATPSPSGAIKFSIAKGRTFLTERDPENTLGTVCVVENPAGMFWDYGENASFPSQRGWVGVKYMTFEGSGIDF
jgi:hypothetical protein